MNKLEKSRLMLDETVDTLRNKPLRSTYMEKLQLNKKAIDLYVKEGVPQPLRFGYAVSYMLENCSVPVKEHDILVGRFVEILPNEEEEAWLDSFIGQWGARNITNFLYDMGHVTFYWEEALQLGISGYIKKCDAEFEKRLKEGADMRNLMFLQGMGMIYRAYRRYIVRYAEACEAAGMTEAAEMCRNLADNPPSTFMEGMQFILFITSIFSIYTAHMNATLCCGRVDDLLRPYYEKDIAEGRLTREEAGAIIDDFNCKSAIILGRGEHQMSGWTASDGYDTGWYRNPMYDSPTYVIIGGYSNKEGRNPLTKLFLERIHPRLENPVYVYRRTKDCPDDEWTLACDKLRQNSTLLIYNDEVVVNAFKQAGIPHEDAVNYTIHGCNWPDLGGKSLNILEIGGPIPRRLYNTIFDLDGNLTQNFTSIDEIYKKYEDGFRAEVKTAFEKYRQSRKSDKGAVVGQVRSCDCFMEGTIDNAVDCGRTVSYKLVLNLLRHVGTAADMMASLEANVFGGDDPITLEKMAEALRADFVGYEDILKRCKNAPKYGRDDDRADRHAYRLMKILSDVAAEEAVNPETGEKDVYVVDVTIADTNHLVCDKDIPATPDGRHANEELSENLATTKGTTESVTALLNSVTKIDFGRCTAGAMNVRMPKNMVSGDEGLETIKMLFETYFEDGGMQLQLSVADTAELRDAQVNPENYPDLMVRITGYSAVFVDMCPKAQEEIIKRDEVS
ncbi:MAG: hypothetical protein E7672_05035 [Ruminococcaceae bacterium]|nr:hypothetical protein [Oscillospiraceae bacterium]